jgi:uncharacterized membrane protein
MNGFNPTLLIPLVAIIFGVMIPIVAIVMDYRRRALVSQERRAMIEKGMVPPEIVEEHGHGSHPRDLASQRARSLRAGTILLALGVGLAVASFVLNYVLTDSYLPPPARGGMAVAASIVGFLGIGNLIYYALTGKKES